MFYIISVFNKNTTKKQEKMGELYTEAVSATLKALPEDRKLKTTARRSHLKICTEERCVCHVGGSR